MLQFFARLALKYGLKYVVRHEHDGSSTTWPGRQGLSEHFKGPSALSHHCNIERTLRFMRTRQLRLAEDRTLSSSATRTQLRRTET